MARTDRRDLRLECRWSQLLARFQRSGQTVRAFCASHRLSENNFYTWRREIEARDRDRTNSAPAEPAPAFVQVRVTAPATIEVVLASGVVVRVPAGAGAVARLADLVNLHDVLMLQPRHTPRPRCGNAPARAARHVRRPAPSSVHNGLANR